MERGSEVCDPPWVDLLPDVLARIFKKPSFQEILTVVPAVCKSWRKVVLQTDCWQEIDIKEWCHCSTPEAVQRMVEMLVKRSRGSMQKLFAFELANEENFALISTYSHNLQVFCIPDGQVTDAIVTQIAPKLVNLTYLGISYCKKMAAEDNPRGVVSAGPPINNISACKRLPRVWNSIPAGYFAGVKQYSRGVFGRGVISHGVVSLAAVFLFSRQPFLFTGCL